MYIRVKENRMEVNFQKALCFIARRRGGKKTYFEEEQTELLKSAGRRGNLAAVRFRSSGTRTLFRRPAV
jgi:hypothetical protein